MQKLTDWVISMNYRQLIAIDRVSSKYELTCLIHGIISEKIGIHVIEIEEQSSLANDLGID